MVRISRYAARGADEGEADAGIAGGRLDQDRVRHRCAPPPPSASIMATPIRSLTLAIGLKNSSFSRRSAAMPLLAAQPAGTRTKGVLPMVSAMLS